ncbi:hypothetical protein [Microbacterium flavum]|uniref:MmyB family transcriptional regulator n=1 Tax=Microbacterium flavum TaxID=415216 RepID=UPI003D1550BF
MTKNQPNRPPPDKAPDRNESQADSDLTAACLIASLRHTIGNDVTDPRLAGLTDELHNKSERFRHIWGRHEVRSQRGATLLLSHPSAGELRLNREQLAINATPHMKLVVYSPAR